MLALECLANARCTMQKIEETQLETIKMAETTIADSIEIIGCIRLVAVMPL